MSTDEAEVRATIDRYWDAWFAAVANPPNPDSPELNELLTGQAWATITGSIREMKANGEFVRQPQPSVFERRTTTVVFDTQRIAHVRECIVDDLVVVRSNTNQIVNDSVSTYVFDSTLANDGTGWRITTTTESSKHPGVNVCPES